MWVGSCEAGKDVAARHRNELPGMSPAMKSLHSAEMPGAVTCDHGLSMTHDPLVGLMYRSGCEFTPKAVRFCHFMGMRRVILGQALGKVGLMP